MKTSSKMDYVWLAALTLGIAFLLSVLANAAMATTIEITDQNAVKKSKEIMTSGKSIVLIFHAEWCESCKRLMPMLKEIEAKYDKQITFVHVDTDKAPKFSKEVTYIPFIVAGTIQEVKGIIAFTGNKEDLEKQIKALTGVK